MAMSMHRKLEDPADVLSQMAFDDDELADVDKYQALIRFSIDCGWILSATFMVLTMQSGFALCKF